MRYTYIFAHAVGILSSTVLADIATIDLCSQDPSNNSPITVSSQYQPVSTCVPQTENSQVVYSYSTYAYVSTVIPCRPDGTSVSSVVVTDTAQWITVTKFPDATTTAVAVATGAPVSEVVEKQGLCRFDEIGSWFIPGWGGSGLCTECEQAAEDGSKHQHVHIQECHWRENFRTCVEYDEYWYWSPDLQSPAVAYPVCATQAWVGAAGTYTFTFPQPPPTSIITAGGSVVTAIGAPWDAYITTTGHGPTTFEFTTTLTQTINPGWHYATDQPTIVVTVSNPPATGFPPPPPPGNQGPGNDGPTITGPGSGGPTMSGIYTTITNTPGGSDVGSVPVTVTIASPSGGAPGTVVVLDPNTGADSATLTGTFSMQPSGPFVTETASATGSFSGTAPITITIATPSGTDPGTVVIISPSSGTATGPTNINSATITGTSTATGPTSSFTDEVSAQLTTTCIGTVCIVVSATLPIGDVGLSATLLPASTTGTGVNQGSATVTSTNPDVTTTCIGTVCIEVSASVPIGDLGASITLLPSTSATVTGSATSPSTTCTDELCVSVGVSGTEVGATITAGVGSGSNTATGTATNPSSTCTDAVCLSVVVSGTGVDATITAGVGDGSGTATATGTNPSSTCTDAVCVSVGISGTEVGATITAGVGDGSSTATATGTNPSSTCTDAVCVSVGISGTEVGATITAGVNGGSSTAAGTGANPSSTCTDGICVSVGVSVSNDADATVTAGVSSSGASASGRFQALDVVTTTSNGAATTGDTASSTCTGLLCASVGVSLSDTGATATAQVGAIVDSSSTTPVTAEPAAATTGGSESTCTGVLCASVGVSVASDVGATATAGIGNSASTSAAAISVAVAAATTPLAVATTSVAVAASVSVSLKKRDPEPSALVQYSPRRRSYDNAVPVQRRATSAACAASLNICAGFNLNSLFQTVPCVSQYRTGCGLGATVNAALASCLSSKCGAYGATADGSVGLTSTLSISEIEDQLESFIEAHNGVCGAGQSVVLYSTNAACSR